LESIYVLHNKLWNRWNRSEQTQRKFY